MDTDFDSSYTFSPIFLKYLRQQICTLYRNMYFIWKVWTTLVRNMLMMENGFSRHQNSSDFSIITNLLTLIDILLDFIDQFTGRKRECCAFRPGNYYYLILFDILFFNILSWILLLNDCLETRSLHIIAKFDEHITFV